jgi:hypothetical protein
MIVTTAESRDLAGGMSIFFDNRTGLSENAGVW